MLSVFVGLYTGRGRLSQPAGEQRPGWLARAPPEPAGPPPTKEHALKHDALKHGGWRSPGSRPASPTQRRAQRARRSRTSPSELALHGRLRGHGLLRGLLRRPQGLPGLALGRGIRRAVAEVGVGLGVSVLLLGFAARVGVGRGDSAWRGQERSPPCPAEKVFGGPRGQKRRGQRILGVWEAVKVAAVTVEGHSKTLVRALLKSQGETLHDEVLMC